MLPKVFHPVFKDEKRICVPCYTLHLFFTCDKEIFYFYKATFYEDLFIHPLGKCLLTICNLASFFSFFLFFFLFFSSSFSSSQFFFALAFTRLHNVSRNVPRGVQQMAHKGLFRRKKRTSMTERTMTAKGNRAGELVINEIYFGGSKKSIWVED